MDKIDRDNYRIQWLENAHEHPEIWREMAKKAGTWDANHPAFIKKIEEEQDKIVKGGKR